MSAEENCHDTPIPQTFEKKLTDSRLLTGCLRLNFPNQPWTDNTALTEYQQWQTWRQKLIGAQDKSAFYLCFKLNEATEKYPNDWDLKFIVSLKQDPSLKLELDEYWRLNSKMQQAVKKQFGKEFEKRFTIKFRLCCADLPANLAGIRN